MSGLRLLYLYRYRVLLAVVAGTLLFAVVKNSGGVCSDQNITAVVQQLCDDFYSGLATGSLCQTLCHQASSQTLGCIPNHSGKYVVFTAEYGGQSVYVKSAYPTGKRDNNSEDLPPMDEKTFRQAVRQLVSDKLNVTITPQQLERLLRLDSRDKISSSKRHVEMAEIFTLLQSQEYLLSLLFSDQDVFPYVYATCGHLYAVESLSPFELDNYLFDGRDDWSQRLRYGVLVMDFLEQLETEFPDPLRLCDVKLEHFGLTLMGRLKFLDLDVVHTDNIVQRITGGGATCANDDQCDLFDCKGSCNGRTRKCDLGVTNNNLQVICEKLFVGWTSSGKLVVPGLLLTDYTPMSLASLLRQCADTGRGAVPEDIRQTLYTTLTELDQQAYEKESSAELQKETKDNDEKMDAASVGFL